MNELALFAGAGGGCLTSRILNWRTVCAVEYDDYCRHILASRQNDGSLDPFPVWDDVATFDGRVWRGHIDVITGGFPCQPFSSAPRGRRVAADRWPDMLRIIQDVRPRFVFAENVAKEPIERAASDLWAMGYEVRAIPLAASDLGADHVRERYWLLAYADDKSELLRGFYAEMACMSELQDGIWSSLPGKPRMADGVAKRMDRFRATGNGWVPSVAIAALLALVGAD